ncbi:MAG: winged helix-turn-helix transcriptional regulator [Methanomicrobia archaeon]|nr:winged helix-turn-helix transcriptional regulator [Methanomicrobia archaeon]
MGRERLDGKLLQDAYILLQPARYRIVKLLAEQPMHISALSTAMGIASRIVAFHLRTLEDFGFVKCKYEISDDPKTRWKALRLCTVTDKVADVIAELKRAL